MNGPRGKMFVLSFSRRVLFLLAAFLLSGCTGPLLEMASDTVFQRQDINLPEKNQAAADLIISQAQTHITKHTPISVAPLSEFLQPEISSAFGAMVTEQIGVRLSQLGYNVQLEYVSAYTDMRPPKPETPEILLTGTYNPGYNHVSVSLRMLNIKTRRIIASFDYELPLTREIGDLIQPQPRIFKLSSIP